MLKELESGEQRSTLVFGKTSFWLRIYELHMAARIQNIIALIAIKIGDLVEVDQMSLEGFSRSLHVKINIDLQRPLKKGLHIEMHESHKLWIEFKYERLPSFCYVCGTLGHLRKECDLEEGVEALNNLPKKKLPFGD
ncbi:hypothetical protein ACS0TY_003003 [Phlomoides rotata]